MPNQINRDVYVLSNKIKDPIYYVQGTDAIDIVFNFRDFEIPDNSLAQVFVSKPSGKGVYNTAVIAGNAVTVNTTPEMFSEIGNTELQINIRNNNELLTSFIQPVVVQKNLSFHGESGNESDFFEEYIEKIDTAISEADTATDSANAAASAANLAAEDIRQKAEDGYFSATVSIGTVTTGDPDAPAAVNNSGTPQNAIFNFTIPKGEKGDEGEKGDPGDIDDLGNTKVTFSEASARDNLSSGDTVSTLFGKISKWFSDLGTAAFRGVANVLTISSAGKYVLDAYQGKVLNDNMGTLSELSTSAKINLVSAINEINTGLSELKGVVTKLNANVAILDNVQAGTFENKKHGDIIKISRPVTTASAAFLIPRYNAGLSMRCNFSGYVLYNGDDSFPVNAYDIGTETTSTSTTLSGYYVIIPYNA